MARAIWSGSIVFGIVNIPVQMFPAVRDHDIHFNQISLKEKKRIRYKKVAEGGDREIPADEIVKGWQVGKGHYVVLDDGELEKLAAHKTHTMDIVDFVALDQIDPLYFDQPYYLAPAENAGRSFDLFFKALEQSGRVAIAQWVMRTKEILGAIRPLNGGLCVETMRYADEVVKPEEVGAKHHVEVKERELAIARQLIDAMSADFDPTKYKDEYRERVLAYLDQKAKGEGELVIDEDWGDQPARTGKVMDLMAALEESLKSAGGHTVAARAASHRAPRAQIAHKKAAGSAGKKPGRKK